MSRAAKRVPLAPEIAYRRLNRSPQWIVERGRIYRDFRFENFKAALSFANAVANIADRVGHHPNMFLHEYHFVRVETYDHLTGGLSTKDLELIRAIDRLNVPQS